MGVFGASGSFEIWTEIASVPRSKAVAVLHDHEFFLHQDPNFESLAPVSSPRGGITPVPEKFLPQTLGRETKCYEVTDVVPSRFARLVPGKARVVNRYQITDLEDGIFVNLRAALDVVSDRRVYIRGGEGEGEGERGNVTLVQEVGYECNKLLVGLFKGQYEEHWRWIHEAIAARMGGEVVRHSGPVC